MTSEADDVRHLSNGELKARYYQTLRELEGFPGSHSLQAKARALGEELDLRGE